MPQKVVQASCSTRNEDVRCCDLTLYITPKMVKYDNAKPKLKIFLLMAPDIIKGLKSHPIVDKKLSRRDFVISSVGSLAGLSLLGGGSNALAAVGRINEGHTAAPYNELVIPPLFCLAYITPDAPGQGGQEHIVARYPLAIVPQDTRRQFILWRDKVKSFNPAILMLGYQMVIEETTVPGPGHDYLRAIKDAWAVYPGGYCPTVGPVNKKRRIFDPRNSRWEEGFIRACRATLASYPYDGLFFDQCSIFIKSHPSSVVREEMKAALQSTLSKLRLEFPNKIFIGNSRFKWDDLNGEMNEARILDLEEGSSKYSGHATPSISLYQSYIKNSVNIKTVEDEMKLVHSRNGLYGVCVDAQHALWFDFFDTVPKKRIT